MNDDTQLYDDKIMTNQVDDETIKEAEKEIDDLKKKAVFNLDIALDTYDPTFPRYIPSEYALEFFNLMRMVQGKDFEFDTPMAHYFVVDLLLNSIIDPIMFPYSEEVCRTITIDHLRLAFMESRGMAKSTIVITFFGIYSAIKGILPNGIGKVYFYLVLSASTRGGSRVNALATKAIAQDSEFLNNYFEEMRFTETESEFVRKGKGKREDRSFLIRYQGIGTGVRGIRYGSRRVCTIICDDIILNQAAAFSKTIRDNLESLIFADAEASLRGGGKGRIIHCFTPFSYTDVNTKLVLDGVYTPCVIPIAKKVEPENISLKNIVSSWASMHPTRSIYNMIKSATKANKLGSLMQERFLRLTVTSNRLVPDACIQWTNVLPIIKNIYNYNVYITTDFTTTSGENSDFSGVAMWAVSNNNDWFLLDLALRKMGMKEQYNVVLGMAAKMKRKGKYVEIGVEVDGNQQAHIYSLEEEMMKRGDFYTFARDKNNPMASRKGILSRSSGVKKHERFRIAVAEFMLPKKMWFPEHLKDNEDMKEMVAQIKGATHEGFTRHDDACFTANTMVWLSNGDKKRIDEVEKGDEVLTSSPYSVSSKCQAAIMTGEKLVTTYVFSDGSEISMTDNHPVYTNFGWVEAGKLTSFHIIIKVKECHKLLKNLDISGIKNQVGTISQQSISKEKEDGYTNIHGVILKENNLKGIMFTIPTIIKITTSYQIWSYFTKMSMLCITKRIAGFLGQKKIKKKIDCSLMKLELKLQNGISPKKVESGIGNTGLRSVMHLTRKIKKEPVLGVVKKLCHTSKKEMYTVVSHVNLKPMLTGIKMIIPAHVKYAINSLIGINRKKLVVKSVEKNLPNRVLTLPLNNVLVVGQNSLPASQYKNTAHSHVEITTIQIQRRKSENKMLEVYPALSVEIYLKQVERMLNTVHMNVVGVTIVGKKDRRREKVYNLQVSDTHAYFVGSGVLVHNCDLISQLTLIEVVQPTGTEAVGADEFKDRVDPSIWGSIPDDKETNNSSIIF